MLQKVLPVPYFVQPTPITCQSTCLKMYGKYMARKIGLSSMGANKSIQDIWTEINTGNERPVQARNAYQNMQWWLEKYYHPRKFEIFQTTYPETAIEHAKQKIDVGFPIMVSTNHDRTAGHIILIIGYRQLIGGPVSQNVEFVCHDPYGRFDPQLGSKQFGARRYEGGMSLAAGSEDGPGKGVVYDNDGIRRVREDKHSCGKFYLISAKS